ncbi:MAG: glutamine-hydrolyzing carbamoyl-phosphate synthase small subunit [candidate division Zixibacteria bacterium]
MLIKTNQPVKIIKKSVDARLVLEDGTVFAGRRFGALVDTDGEVVFNTALTGYQEILTDPSYAGQMVVMTYPQIGNYGISDEDFESRKLFLSALIVKENSRIASNWRSDYSLDDYLKAKGIPGLEGLDTRMLVRHLRTKGAMRGVIGGIDVSIDVLLNRAKSVPPMAGRDLAITVTKGQRFAWNEDIAGINGQWKQQDLFAKKPESKYHVVAVDYGVKWNILRCLINVGCRVTVVPATTTADEIIALKPSGLLLSNGPGDPDPLQYSVDNIRQLLGKIPIFGICLGHQLLGLAAGGKTYKLKFGHRGGNHPIIDLQTRKVEITSHNHGFAVDADSLPKDRVEITHVNLNDQTVEGLRLTDVPAFSVQYHPEAAPGPHDAHYLFNRFTDLMREFQSQQ